MSLNCQSINAKYNEFQILVENINNISPLSVICLQESWLDCNCDTSLFELPGYKLTNQGKTRCSDHGGLMIYVHEQFNVSKPLKIMDQITGWEYVCIEISHK